MNALTDHLWQSLLCVMLVSGLAALARHQSARVRLGLWRVAAVKMLVPFSLLGAVGAWFGFPIRYAGDPPPRFAVDMVDRVTPWFAPTDWVGAWIESGAARNAICLGLLIIAIAAMRWLLGNIH